MKSKADRISSKLGYGFADIYGGGTFLIISIFYIDFLTGLGLPGILAGSIPVIGKIWDAISDPLMGSLVDRTKSKYGSKRVYLLYGSFVAALTFALMWISLSGPLIWTYIFYLVTFLLFSTGFTIVMIPYNALLPDMVSDYHLRGQYTGFRMIFSAVSAVIAGLIPQLIINKLGTDQKIGYLWMGIIFGIIFFVSILITFKKTWETPSEKEVDPFSFQVFVKDSAVVYKNRSFRYFLGIFLLGQGSADFVMMLFLFFLRDVLNQENQYTFIMSGILGSQILAMIIFQYVLKKTSKKIPILVGFPIRIIATFSMLFFAYSGAPILPIFIASFISGFGTAASSVTAFSILPDLTDVDELISGQRRPGLYSGMATFTRKIANGLAFGVIGILLSVFQHDKSLTVQSDFTIQGIKWSFIILPIIFMIGTIIFTYLFPLNKKEFDMVRKDIDRRKGIDSSEATQDEKLRLQKVTGYTYNQLWGSAKK